MAKRVLLILALIALLELGSPLSAWAGPPLPEGALEAPDAPAPAGVVPSFIGQAVRASDVGIAWKSQVTTPGVYIFYDYRNYDPALFPAGIFVGGHMSWEWRSVEKSYHNYDWTEIDNWIAAETALGKKVGLEIISYTGASSYDSSIKGNVAPSWLPKLTCADWSGREFNIPRYWYSTFRTEYQALINAFGAKYNNDSRVAWIEIATGTDGENQPSQPDNDPYNPSNKPLQNCLVADGLSSSQWIAYMKDVINYYRAAFPNKPLMIQHFPKYITDSERREIRDFAGPLGVGFKGNGLTADRNKMVITSGTMQGTGLDDPAMAYSTTVPIGYETYQFYLYDPIIQYWAVLNALDKHADYLAMDANTFSDGNPLRIESLRFANRYLGKDVNNTPEVWVALRESGYTYYPQYGNYSFYLKQDDSVAGGRTKVTTWRGSVWGISPREYYIENPAIELNQSFMNNTAEGWITRRTDQASGNPYMWFKVDDGFINGGTNPISITVTYLDRGTDTWSLEYDGPGGALTPAGTVTKTNTNTWKKYTFFINDARLANGLTGGSDFRINCNNDGNEYIHMVMLAKRSSQVVYSIPLVTGENRVSIPVVLADTSVNTVLAPIAGQYKWVMAFDGVTKQWKIHDPSLWLNPNPLLNIDHTMGVLIRMNQPGTLVVTGTLPSTTNIPLTTGANLVGFPRANSQAVAAALGGIAGNVTKIFEYEAATGTWRKYDPSLWLNPSPLTEMRPGFAYQIEVTANCTLTITN